MERFFSFTAAFYLTLPTGLIFYPLVWYTHIVKMKIVCISKLREYLQLR